MAKTQLEFYESLKPHVGEEGAKVIAELFPQTEYVTKEHFDLTFARFETKMRAWMLAFFVPLWIGVYLSLAAIVISIFVKT
jgi:hypothetical protein